MENEFDTKYAKWQYYWQQLATLKKKYQPEYAPIELWMPLEEKCKTAFKAMIEARHNGK